MKSMQKNHAKNNLETLAAKLKPGEGLWVGIDVHKRSWNVSIFSADQGNIAKAWHMDADLNALLNTLRPIVSHIRKIAYEAGPTGFGLARFLKANELPVMVISPADIPQSRRKSAKSDRIDAEALARELPSARLRPVYIPTLEEEDARDSFRNRNQLTCKIRRVKAQIKSHLLRWGVGEPEGLSHWSKAAVAALPGVDLPPNALNELRTYLSELEHLEELKRQATAQMESVVQEQHGLAYTHALSVPGVGTVTASGYLLELPQLREIQNHRQLAQLIGLAPLKRGSGEQERECGRGIGGKKLLRSLLIEATWRWVGKDPGAKAVFDRICAGKQNRRKKSIVAMARRLAIILWRLIIEERPYRPHDLPEIQKQSV